MQITNIEARWQRRLPREQYGHAEVELKAYAIINDDDEAGSCADALLELVRNSVADKLGISVPASETKVDKEPAKKKPGRPKKETASKPKKEDKPAKEADDVPGDDDDVPGDNISTKPEDRSNPDEEVPGDDDDDDDVPGEEEEELTAVELAKIFTKAVKDKKISVPEIQELLASFKVSKTAELKGKQIGQARDQFELIVNGI